MRTTCAVMRSRDAGAGGAEGAACGGREGRPYAGEQRQEKPKSALSFFLSIFRLSSARRHQRSPRPFKRTQRAAAAAPAFFAPAPLSRRGALERRPAPDAVCLHHLPLTSRRFKRERRGERERRPRWVLFFSPLAAAIRAARRRPPARRSPPPPCRTDSAALCERSTQARRQARRQLATHHHRHHRHHARTCAFLSVPSAAAGGTQRPREPATAACLQRRGASIAHSRSRSPFPNGRLRCRRCSPARTPSACIPFVAAARIATQPNAPPTPAPPLAVQGRVRPHHAAQAHPRYARRSAAVGPARPCSPRRALPVPAVAVA